MDETAISVYLKVTDPPCSFTVGSVYTELLVTLYVKKRLDVSWGGDFAAHTPKGVVCGGGAAGDTEV